jgi:FkbM family methyltransferase
LIKKLVKSTLAVATANRGAQRLLERFVVAAQWLMGIGSGAVAEESGEEVVVRLLRKKQTAGHTLSIFDVGANRGQFLTMLLGGLDGLPVTVHAFEPSAVTFALLKEGHGSDSRLHLNNLALGRAPGEMTLYSNEDASGIASLYKRRLDHFELAMTQSESVRVETLDAYCATHAIEHIDLLKIDVEGNELDVLTGARELLRKGAIDLITFEFGGCNIDARNFLQDFFYFFSELGSFQLYRITPAGYLSKVERYREVDEQFRTTNFLVRREAATTKTEELH